jgi:hypothetical protein
MIKTLPSIIATFLSVGATFLAAYWIYLHTVQSNLEDKIQNRGSEIATQLKNAPTFKMLALYDSYLLKEYQARYPEKPYISILEKIASDLISAGVFQNKEEMEQLSVIQKNNLQGPVIGRVFIWLIEKSLDFLSPPEINWPGRRRISSLTPPPQSNQEALYPYGHLGVEEWSNDFRRIKNYVDFLLIHKKTFLNDMNQFVAQLESKNNKFADLYKKYDYEVWLSEMEEAFTKIETQNLQVQSLLRLKTNYSISNRLPNIKWISVLGSLTFIFGIVVPLILASIKVESSVPSTVNIVLLVVSFTFLIGGIVLIGKDVLSIHKSEINNLRYLLPLKKQLTNYKEMKPQQEIFTYDIINQLLTDEKSKKLPRKLLATIKIYRDTVVESNSCSEKIFEQLSDALMQNKTLETYKADPMSGGHVVSIISLFSKDSRQDMLDELRKPERNVIIQINYDRSVRDIFKIKAIDNNEDIKVIESELTKIYDKQYGNDQVKYCLSKRKSLEQYRNQLIAQINEITGDN